MPLFDTLAIGSAVQDVLLKSSLFAEKKDIHAPDGMDACLPLGSKIALDDVLLTTGGGATNAAVTFTRFGLKTACIARIGQDPGGKAVIADLEQHHIDTQAIQKDPKRKTAYSLVLVAGSGHRVILTHRGAAAHLEAKRIPWSRLRANLFYITSLAGNVPLLKQFFAQAKKQKALIAWNPGNAELMLGLSELTPFIKQTDILILNSEEAGALAEEPPRHLSSIIQKLGPLPKHVLIVTAGGRGAYVHDGNKTFFAPPLPAHRINTIGAGDAFGSAFAAFFARNHSIQDCLRAGMLNATGVITHMGAKTGILKAAPKTAALKKVRIFPLERVVDHL